MKPLILLAGAAVAIGALGTGAAAASAADPSPAPVQAPAEPPAVVHGESVMRDADGKTRVYTWQTGTVTQKSDSSITVHSSDGTTWTWALTSDTTIRKESVKVGDTVMIGGPRDGDTRTATHITDPPDFDKLRDRMKDLRKRMEDLRGGVPAPPMDFPLPRA
ncbi:hypothetical protein [Actinomadura sp. 6N118]|uniref:hypothetical protein n=1 Tax=Actinomadura sp. 6N118 TaxID=3375151 RepID=UPI0037BE4B48